ncbi:hypothetical protein J2X84_001972 [Pseudomonas corrugata]|uniref:hypothetical protein n=1 Tax=Pseudomonas corrugata TaxID=47879 RepID=UPI00285AB6AE|nr:hypothetical protein [Pseudomonas corrugata]MDR7283148.1 hypothetical protein [Pseudomonas corrugata]
MSPFVPFPIFPPYQFWMPEDSYPVPVNVEVCARLEEIDPAAQPFTSVYFCHAFLRWYAITAPRHSFEYSLSVHPLETLVLWSFVKKKPLVELRADDIDELMSFYVAPPATWSAPPVAKYIENYVIPFSEWTINPRWRPFNRAYDQDGTSAPIVRQSTSDRFKVMRDFFDFYLGLVGSNRKNPVSAFRFLQRLQTPRKSVPPILTERQLDWLFEFAAHCGRPLSPKIAVFLSLARFTEHSATAIVGDELNKSTLDQFRRSELGRWSFSIVKGGDGYQQLPVGFNPILESFLRAAGVNARSPLPSTHLFPKLFRSDGLTKASIAREIIRFRKGLVEAAQASDDPEIQIAVNLYKNLSFSLVRRSAKMLG